MKEAGGLQRTCHLLIIAAFCVPAASAQGIPVAAEFNRDIRPILADKCWVCHGPDAKNKNIRLRLDSEAAAKADLGGRAAIVAGDAAASEAITRIKSENKARRMPPVYSGMTLTQAEIATLERWVQDGAKWEKHWAFLPVRRLKPPAGGSKWPRNDIDRFILARLTAAGLAPSPEADPATLIRRVSLDLTGLPPTPAEVDAFLADPSDAAYEKLVEGLLASPRFGERMATPWLAAARYADTNGYQYDGERVMWRWRDWVIHTFNRNLPFDQFVLEQLAGDLLPNPTLDQRIATGFNRNHRSNTEVGIIPEEYVVEYVADRVETASTVFMALTLGCARCHNHKYDPFTQKEFYQLAAYFNQVPDRGRAISEGNTPPLIKAPTPEQQRKLHNLQNQIQSARQQLQSREDEIRTAQQPWERSLSDGLHHWFPKRDLVSHIDFEAPLPPEDTAARAPGKLGNALSLDGKTFVPAGDIPLFDIEDPFTFAAWVYLDGPSGTILSRKRDTVKGAGHALHVDGGKVALSIIRIAPDNVIRVRAREKLAAGQWHHVAATYSGLGAAEGVRLYINGHAVETDTEADGLTSPFRRAGGLKEPLRIGTGFGPEQRLRGRVDEVLIYARNLSDGEIEALSSGLTLQAIAAKPEAARSRIEADQMRWYFLETAASEPLRQLWKRITGVEDDEYKFKRSIPSVMVMAELPRRRETFVLKRGAYDQPGEKVEPGIPDVLSPPSDLPPNRLGLARWLTGPDNPLLARVTINRFWQIYFGTGIVKTTEDFGSQGEWPSHPELLDWLASEFVRSGWNVKAVQKLIVLSATYRQSSRVTPELAKRDPENRLMARAPRLRLAAETVRDQALFAAGLLRERVGGPSVKPYQPAGLWKELTMNGLDYVQSTGADLYRRSLYTFWKRTVPPPMLMNFDAAHRETCVVRDSRTNTPLQALNLMNDVTFVEAARALGQRMMREAGTEPSARLRHGFRLVVARDPTAAEARILLGSLRFHRDLFATDPDRAKKYLAIGDMRSDPELKSDELAAYAAVASLVLNSDAAISRN